MMIWWYSYTNTQEMVDFLVDIWEQDGLYDWDIEDWGSAENNSSSCL